MRIPSFVHLTIQKADKLFLPERYMGNPIQLRKARFLTYITLFLMLIALAFEVSNAISGVSGPSLKIALATTIGLMVGFKKFGNFNISGNLLAMVVFVVQAEAVFLTGGLFSDNLLWILAAPLLALLFANYHSGLFWLASLIGFTLLLYFYELNAEVSFREQTYSFDALYFLITYIGLFVIITGIVLIFATGQANIIAVLNEKQKELSEQKEELISQADSLRQAERQLLESNSELEQFAYAASHDLKEPLRMIGMYTQLIKKRMEENADETTHEYMHFVSDGVVRMERLLHDLLEYSRLGKSRDRSNETDLNEILFVVVNNLTATMRDSEAEILVNELPVLPASNTEMIQLFQNLIANSIKFRRKEVNPVIDIMHRFESGIHHFKLKDNGIGISEEHREKVFNIFERIHGRKEYEGTGIGLATCKKIVSNMGGDIWVEPSTEQGTTFVFTFPASNPN